MQRYLTPEELQEFEELHPTLIVRLPGGGSALLPGLNKSEFIQLAKQMIGHFAPFQWPIFTVKEVFLDPVAAVVEAIANS